MASCKWLGSSASVQHPRCGWRGTKGRFVLVQCSVCRLEDGHIRTDLDIFTLERPGGGLHQCLVQKPMWIASRTSSTGIPMADSPRSSSNPPYTRYFYNSLVGTFTQLEMESPSPRKFVNGAPVYASRRFGLPKNFGGVVLSDFGAAVRGV